MAGLATSRCKYALVWLQGHCSSGVAFWPSLLDNGNWAVSHPRSKRRRHPADVAGVAEGQLDRHPKLIEAIQ